MAKATIAEDCCDYNCHANLVFYWRTLLSATHMEWLGVLAIAYLARGAARVPEYAHDKNAGSALRAALMWWRGQPLGSVLINLLYMFAIVAVLYWLMGFVTASPTVRLSILLLWPLIVFISAFS
jgi:hypothetical protein